MKMYFLMFAREAWNKLGDMDRNSSMKHYVELVNKVDPNWENLPLVDGGNNPIEVETHSVYWMLNCMCLQSAMLIF